MSEFNVKFRGVRGSFPIANKNFLNFGGNTSCVEINVGGNLIILDAGTGIINVGDDLMEQHLASSINPEERTPIKATLLISHIHQDHLLGLTFFKPIHINTTNLSIFGVGTPNKDLKTNLSELIFGETFPIDLGSIKGNVEINNLTEDKIIVLKSGEKPLLLTPQEYEPNQEDVVITFYKSYVHPQNGVMIYRITYKGKSVVYATDKECYFGGDKNFSKFAKDCDLLIHDAQYTTEDYLSPHSPKQGYGHSTYDMAVEVMKQTKAKNLAFFHYDPSYDDTKLARIKEHYTFENKNIIMSSEGLEINIL